jgi:lipopolysaccharide biosynthesis glycosyltransferase
MKDDKATVNPISIQPRVPLVFASDESYAMPLATALRSIAEAKRTIDPFEVYILYNTFQERARRRVTDSLPAGSFSIHWVLVDLTHCQAYSTSRYISKITYARLAIPELLPRSVTKALYLDSDILVFGDLTALQESELSGAAIGAVLDRLDAKLKAGETLWTKDIPSVRNYFNAGVLLIDLTRWREDRISERAFEYLRKHPRTPLSDQDALNVVCDRVWKQLEPRWNFINDYEMQLSGMPAREEPTIIHFAGPLKPWQIGIRDPNTRIYDLIRSRTCFARNKRDKARDFLKAPLRFFESGLWWQTKRVLRRYEAFRRIRLYIMQTRGVNTRSL